MSKRMDKRKERTLRDVEFCDGCGCACDGRSRSDVVRERARLSASRLPVRVV
jgi:hypothetical protein